MEVQFHYQQSTHALHRHKLTHRKLTSSLFDTSAQNDAYTLTNVFSELPYTSLSQAVIQINRLQNYH